MELAKADPKDPGITGQAALRAVYRACFSHRKDWVARADGDSGVDDYPFDFSCILGSKICQRSLQRLLKLYDLLATAPASSTLGAKSGLSVPNLDDLDDLYEQLLSLVDQSGPTRVQKREARELLRFVDNEHFKALIITFCLIFNNAYEIELPEIHSEVDEDEGLDVRIVKLIKNQEPLGATIKLDEQSASLVIARVMHGGVADRSGCVHVGDRVLQVNGVDVAGKQPADVVRLLGSPQNGCVTFKLVPAVAAPHSDSDSVGSDQKRGLSFVRALVDYDPKLDAGQPCPEAALAFRRGDILRIVDASDNQWWQAVPADAKPDAPVALVPAEHESSRTLQSTLGSNGSLRCPHAKPEASLDTPTRIYEQVTVVQPCFRANKPRPLVLLGPPGIGRDELRRRLILSDANRFGAAIPHTSRRPKPGETDGVEYRFVGRQQMQKWVDERAFLEYGEYKGNFYGTTLDSVRQVMDDEGKMCVLTPNPSAVAALREHADIRPWLIFIRPLPGATLATGKKDYKSKLTITSSHLSDEDVQKMTTEADRIEKSFGAFFDHVLPSAGNVDASFRELIHALSKLESAPQWMPTHWVQRSVI